MITDRDGDLEILGNLRRINESSAEFCHGVMHNSLTSYEQIKFALMLARLAEAIKARAELPTTVGGTVIDGAVVEPDLRAAQADTDDPDAGR
jgi:hypothetical protein